MPVVINIREAPKGWLKDPNYVYIGRWHRSWRYGLIPTSKWQNPFKGERNEAINKFKEYLINNPALMKDLWELDGKTLVCWCKPLPCHGDVIKEICEQR